MCRCLSVVNSLVSTSLMAEPPFWPRFLAWAILQAQDGKEQWGIVGEGKQVVQKHF